MKAVRLLLFILSVTFAANLSAQTVYTTKTGEKYHKSDCRYLKNSKKEYSLEKAQSLGYSACSVCKPTTNNTKATKQTLNNNTTTVTTTTTTSTKATATQCTGKTQSGTRCKRKTKNANGRCYQH
jgi:hypothetical protein